MINNDEIVDVKVEIKLVHDNAVLPTQAFIGDACVDLYAVEEKIIHFGRTVAVDTGLQVAIPHGWEAQIRPRSGLALKHGITVGNSPGTIDSGYRGNIKIIMTNHEAGEPYHVKIGERVAQMAIRKVPNVKFVLKEELSETERGVNGFGSTGK